VRTKRSVALSLNALAAGSTRTEAAPIFAVLAEEPVFAEIARDAHARYLADGRLENEADARSLHQWLTRASS
jgi:hypothetical protein